MMPTLEAPSVDHSSTSSVARARRCRQREVQTVHQTLQLSSHGGIRATNGYIAVLTLAVATVALLLGTNAATAAPPRLDGQEAPDFVLKTLEQQNLRLSEFRGQVVLINFWASWCGACRQAMPALNDIRDKYQRAGLVMLSVNLDDEANRALHMAGSLKIKYPVLLDDRKAVSRTYQVDTMPLTVLIDREGVVRFAHVGYNSGDERKFVAPLRALLNE